MTARGQLLEDAKGAIESVRNKDYGDPKDNFEDTAALWNAYFVDQVKGLTGFTAADVAVAMMLLKIARMHGDETKRDTWMDIAGYAACGYECVAPEPMPVTGKVYTNPRGERLQFDQLTSRLTRMEV